MIKTYLILNKYNLYKLGIALLIILNLFILALKNFEKKQIFRIISKNNGEKKLIKDVLLLNILSFRTKLNNQFVYSIANNDSVLFSDLSKDKNKLILYYAGTSCDICVDSAITAIKVNNVHPDNVLVITNITNWNQLYIEQKKYEVYKIFSLQKELGLSFDELNYPFYFILDSNFFVNCMFIPDKSLPSLTNEYIKYVKEHLL